MPGNKSIDLPPVHSLLFRAQTLSGEPEDDQTIKEKNALVIRILHDLQNEAEHASELQKEPFDELKKAVANFNHGPKKALNVDRFRAELAEMIDSMCESLGIEFAHGLIETAAAPATP